MTAAELILTGGVVHTLDPARPAATALAAGGGRILAVGGDDEIAAWRGPGTRVVALRGRTVIPGINDAHLHLAMWAISRPPYQADLRPLTSLAQVGDAVAAQARRTPPGRWAVGRGWTLPGIAEFASGNRLPTRHDLDEAAPEAPVFCWHRSEHAAWVNTRALQLAGITRDTPDPDGGEIVRDPRTGEPTGYLVEAAAHLVARHVPEPAEQTWREAIAVAAEELNRRGVTSVTDPMVSPELLSRYAGMRGELPLRLGVLLHWTGTGDANHAGTIREAMRWSGSVSGLGDHSLRVAGVKLFADGIPVLRTSWMYEPFRGGGCGHAVIAADDPAAELAEMVELLHRHRFRIGVHATGDRACDAVARAYEAAHKADPWPARHHLIHASLLSAETARELAALDVTVSTNSLIKWQATDALDAVFDEAANAYHNPVATLLDAGLHVADASDAPITDPDWRRGVQTLVTRRVQGSGRVSGPGERVSRLAALRAWTSEGAYQDGLEDEKGTLVPGRLADLAVLGADPLTVPEEDLHAVPVEMTVLGGRIVHQS
ncbi:amidohydrolase [Actinomadura sp. 1N219]|uniref:amidohydrolase n=1 Tax=Actinomadura sp. 1N219 TaxID=3375152 RepID=UPI00379E3E52